MIIDGFAVVSSKYDNELVDETSRWHVIGILLLRPIRSHSGDSVVSNNFARVVNGKCFALA